MTFFQPDSQLQNALDQILAATWAEFPTLAQNQIAMTWLIYDAPVIVNTGGTLSPEEFWKHRPKGTTYRGVECIDPAQMVQLFYAVALQEWLNQEMVPNSDELARALQDMMVTGNYDATDLVVDVLTGTTSGPELPPGPFQTWQTQRNLINRYFQSLQWPELATINVNQKLWMQRAYGRERLFLGELLENQNRITTNATARLLHSIIGGVAVSPQRSQMLMDLIYRSLEATSDIPQDSEPHPIHHFLGEKLPPNSQIWSKTALTKRGRHEAAYIEQPNQAPYLLVIFIEGEKNSSTLDLLPFIRTQIQVWLEQRPKA